MTVVGRGLCSGTHAAHNEHKEHPLLAARNTRSADVPVRAERADSRRGTSRSRSRHTTNRQEQQLQRQSRAPVSQSRRRLRSSKSSTPLRSIHSCSQTTPLFLVHYILIRYTGTQESEMSDGLRSGHRSKTCLQCDNEIPSQHSRNKFYYSTRLFQVLSRTRLFDN